MQPQQPGNSRIARFFREAHRRHVFRVAALYIVGTCLVLQVAPVQEPAAVDFEPLPKLANSIAVLPFTNISEDPANEYFADGISGEILHRLAQLRRKPPRSALGSRT